MREWRVGTFSMGILLLGLGTGLIIAQINSVALAEIIFKWWPLLFILLGVEILGQIFINKNNDIKIKYDIFSIFMVFVIIISGLGVQCLTEFGFIEQARIMLASEHYLLETEPSEIAVATGIKRLVIEAPPVSLQIHTSKSDSIVSRASVSVTADSKEKALELLAGSTKCKSYQAGDTQFISFDIPLYGNDFGYDCRISEYKLLIPDKMDVIIKGNGHSVDIDARDISNDWQIQDAGDLELNLSGNNNLTVNAQVDDEGFLEGNVEWRTFSKNDDPQDYSIKGQYIVGAGSRMINIFNSRRITLNSME